MERKKQNLLLQHGKQIPSQIALLCVNEKQIVLQGAISGFNAVSHESFNGIHTAGIPHTGLLV
jgi:hypothetical protein